MCFSSVYARGCSAEHLDVTPSPLLRLSADNGEWRNDARLLAGDGRFLYALDTDARRLHAWRVHEDGRLEEAASTDGLPLTAAGLAAH